MSRRSKNRKNENKKQKKPPDWELGLKILGAIVAVVSLFIGGLKLLDDRGKPQQERRIQGYQKLMAAAALFSEATTMDEADRARKEFRTIYKGQFNEVKDEIVGHAADRFSLALSAWEKVHQIPEDKFTKPRNFFYEDLNEGRLIRFGELSQKISEACRISLEKHKS